MKASLMKCDLPKVDLPKQFQPAYFRVVDPRLAGPPPRPAAGYTPKFGNECQHFAHMNERFFDVRTRFGMLRGLLTTMMTWFIIISAFFLWLGDILFGGGLLIQVVFLDFLVPAWILVCLFDVFFPRSLPVRFDRKDRCAYVAKRGTYYRIPWEELMITLSYNWQYYGSYVYWEPHFYLHLYVKTDHYFCGRRPQRDKRIRLGSFNNEDRMCRFWNTLYGIFEGQFSAEELEKIRKWNRTQAENARNDGQKFGLKAHILTMALAPHDYIRHYPILKFKWPPEIEEKFGKANYY